MTWYLKEGLRPVGPYTTDEIIARLRSGDLQPWDLLWADEQSRWQTVVEWKCFAASDMPAFQLLENAENGPVWVVLQRQTGGDVNSGPFTTDEVAQGLREGRFTGTDFIWKNGMTGWSLLGGREEFASVLGKKGGVSYGGEHDSEAEK